MKHGNSSGDSSGTKEKSRSLFCCFCTHKKKRPKRDNKATRENFRHRSPHPPQSVQVEKATPVIDPRNSPKRTFAAEDASNKREDRVLRVARAKTEQREVVAEAPDKSGAVTEQQSPHQTIRHQCLPSVPTPAPNENLDVKSISISAVSILLQQPQPENISSAPTFPVEIASVQPPEQHPDPIKEDPISESQPKSGDISSESQYGFGSVYGAARLSPAEEYYRNLTQRARCKNSRPENLLTEVVASDKTIDRDTLFRDLRKERASQEELNNNNSEADISAEERSPAPIREINSTSKPASNIAQLVQQDLTLTEPQSQPPHEEIRKETSQPESLPPFQLIETRPPSCSVSIKEMKVPAKGEELLLNLVLGETLQLDSEGELSRCMKDSHAMPSPIHNNGRTTRTPNKLLSGLTVCQASMENMSVAEGKCNDLQRVTQEREMLWAAINEMDIRIKDAAGVYKSQKAELWHKRRVIARYRAQIELAKKENVGLQQALNGVLGEKLMQSQFM